MSALRRDRTSLSEADEAYREQIENPWARERLGGKQIPLLQRWALKYGYDDMQAFEIFSKGVHTLEDIEASGVYRPVETPQEGLLRPAREKGLVERKETLLRTKAEWQAAPPRTAVKHREKLWEKTKQKIDQKILAGPWRAQDVPHEAWNSALRFIKYEGINSRGEEKWRDLDDASGNGNNRTVRMREKLTMPGWDGLLRLVFYTMVLYPGLLLMLGLEDFEAAFTQIALRIEDGPYHMSHLWHPGWGEVAYVQHKAGFFGSGPLPYWWCRAIRPVVFILRAAFGILCDIHMDDLFYIETARWAASACVTVRQVCDLFGFLRSRDKEKGPKATEQSALGGGDFLREGERRITPASADPI